MRPEIDKTIRKQGIIRGLILGGVLTAISITSFYFTISIASPVAMAAGLVLFPYIFPAAASTLLCFNLRNKIGGFWTMRQATTGIFIMFVVSSMLSFVLYGQVFAKVIEPDTDQKIELSIIRAQNIRKEAAKTPDERKAADNNIQETKKSFENRKQAITIPQWIMSIGFNIIFLFVISIIFASFFRREPKSEVSGN